MEADFRRLGLTQPLTEHLGERSAGAQYSYADVIKHLLLMFSIGGEVLDDLNTLREQMQDHPFLSICSLDTVEYVCHELKQTTQVITTEKGVVHWLNEHKAFNELLPALCVKGELLQAEHGYILDYDGHIVENTKRDSAFTYKHTRGYYPVVLSINKLPVFVQNRNGNTPEAYRQLSILTQTLARCKKVGLTGKRFRADACCYEENTVQYLEENHLTYYIRCEMNASLSLALEDEPQWQEVMLGYRKVEVCSVVEPLFDDGLPRRIVAYRYRAQGQLSLTEGNGYRYYAVLTNDTADALSCIEFYLY